MNSPADRAAGVTTSSPPIPRIRARCPRCEYDLSGTVDTWKGAPPPTPEGTCSECGMTVVWAKVLAEPSPPWWFVEAGIGLSPLRSVCTAFMLFRPINFWKCVELGHPVRLGRAMLIVAMSLTLVMALRLALLQVMASTGWPGTMSNGWTTYSLDWFQSLISITMPSEYLLRILAFSVFFPLTMFVLAS